MASSVILSTNTSVIGFAREEILTACEGVAVGGYVTLGEYSKPPYSTMYLCQMQCLPPPRFFLRIQPCVLSNCDPSQTIGTIAGQPILQNFRCFYPFGRYANPESVQNFWVVAVFMTVALFLALFNNILFIAMSTHKSFEGYHNLKKFLNVLCAYEIFAAFVLYLAEFIYWQDGEATIVNVYVVDIVLDPVFAKTFMSAFYPCLALFFHVFYPAKHAIVFGAKARFLVACILPMVLYTFYILFGRVLPNNLTFDIEKDGLVLFGVGQLLNKNVIGGLIFVTTILVLQILLRKCKKGLEGRLEVVGADHVNAGHVNATSDDAVKAANFFNCIQMMVYVELVMLIPLLIAMVLNLIGYMGKNVYQYFDAIYQHDFILQAFQPAIHPLVLLYAFSPCRRLLAQKAKLVALYVKKTQNG